jgi:putative ABC transport system substrate-binding protein
MTLRTYFARRRIVLRAMAALATGTAGALCAQQPPSVARVGVLSSRRRPEPLVADYYGAFPERMRELGYAEGRNLVIEWRFAAGDYERLPLLASELAGANVNAILALGPPGAVAARKVTATIPIVFVMSSDPVAAGLVKSLAKPEGNVTGIFNLAGDLGAKHLEMVMTIAPKLARIAVLVNPANPGHAAAFKEVEAAAGKLGIRAISARAQAATQIESAFTAMAAARAGAVIVTLDPLFIQEVPAIAQNAVRNRLPSIFANREYAEAGGLMSYGQNQVEIYRRAAEYVDRILKGAKPGELPVEQPTKLELCLNNRTARALGLAFPQSLRLMASTVID